MLQEPKHLPVYVASYLGINGEIKDTTIIAKINKPLKKYINYQWGNKTVSIQSLDYNDIDRGCIRGILWNTVDLNTFKDRNAKLVPKDEWIKAVDKANKQIDVENKKRKKKGEELIKRVRY